ncbi:putative RNA-directed DNA polymerase [Tanacetum coccineum]
MLLHHGVYRSLSKFLSASRLNVPDMRPEVGNWKEALSMVANLSGWDLQDMTNGYEYKFIDCISKDILKNLCDGPLHVDENLVGIDSHFNKLNLSRFAGQIRCQRSTKRQGLIQVQLQMIRKIMKIEDLKISSVGEGIMVIKKMMSSKPILLVLDDVDDHEQLEALFNKVENNEAKVQLLWSLVNPLKSECTSFHILREYTLKTQLLRIKMHGDETPDAYLNHAQEYVDALATIGEPVKDKDLIMLVVSGLHEQYNSLKTTITARQSPTTFSKLHVLLSDHDYMLEKTRTPITPYGPQAFYGAHPSNNNRSNNNNNRGNSNNSCGNNNRGCNNGRQFDWASTQNTVYGTCNRCGIGHIPSHCPNRDPSTIRTRSSANFANTRAQSSNSSANWHSDTGANSHVTPDLEAMDNSEAYYGEDALHVGNGKVLPILHIGSSKVYSLQKTFSLKNILHVLEISHNLLSVQNFCHDNDVFFEFHTSYFVVKDESTHNTLLIGPSKHGLYTITLPQLKSINKVSFSAVRASPTIWHRRLGHPHQRLLHSMLSNFSLPVTNKSLSSFCNSCPLGKSLKLPLFESGFRRIIHLRSCPHTSEQNGFVERHNRHVMETGLTLLAQACVPQPPPIMDIVILISLPSVFILLDMLVLMIHNFPSISLKQLPHPLLKTSPYYSSESPYVIPTTDHPSPSSPRSPISSPSSVSHLSPTSQTSPESSNGQPSPVSTTSIPTPPPPTPPPPITQQRLTNLGQN